MGKEIIISIGAILLFSYAANVDLLVHWRFEEVSGRDDSRGRRDASVSGSSYAWDYNGKCNFLQANGQ